MKNDKKNFIKKKFLEKEIDITKDYLEYKKDINNAINDYLYYLDFAEGKIIFKTLLKDCENYFFKFYNINIRKLTNKEIFKKIFGDQKK